MNSRKLQILIIIGLLVFSGLRFVETVTADDAPDTEWDVVFNVWGGARSGQQTSDGGYIATGYTTYYDYSAGSKNIFLIKVDANGNEKWHKTFGTGSGQTVQQTTDGGYIITAHSSLIKTDADGAVTWETWEKTYSGSFEYVQQTTDGGYITAGQYFFQADWGYDIDIWLMKIDSNGEEEWNQTIDYSNADQSWCVQQTSDEGYIIMGGTGAGSDYKSWLIKTNSVGDKQWDKQLSGIGYSSQQTRDGGYIITGSNTPSSGSGGDVWLMKTDSQGNILWENTYGGDSSDYGKCVQETREGGFIIVGNTDSFDSDAYTSIWAIKTDSAGSMKWNKTFSRMEAAGYSVDQTDDGGYFITGSTNHGNVPTDSEFWLIKIKPDEPALDDNGDQSTDTDSIPSKIKVLMNDDSIEEMDLEEYVKGVVAAEMYSDWPIEALKAQAVVARTFAIKNTHHDHSSVDVCTDHTHCQAWAAPPYTDLVEQAVTSTHNMVITYNGEIIKEALFFGHCNGHTRNSEDYAGWNYVPYLRDVACDCGYTEYNGHGVGMCQYGAKAMAEQGSSYEEILKHYYTGIALTSFDSTKTTGDTGGNGTPGFELLFAFLSIIIVCLIMLKKRNK